MHPLLRTTVLSILLSTPAAADGPSTDSAQRIGLRPYWSLDLALPRSQQLAHLDLLDDNAYARTDDNFTFAIHAGSGVLRWTTRLSKPGQRILGPCHFKDFAYFTAQTGVYIYNRQTGRPAAEQRLLHGVVIESARDLATINIGSLHGVTLGTQLRAYRHSRAGGARGDHIADLRVTIVHERQAEARITRLSPTVNPDSGDLVEGDVELPVPLVELPFAPSSPALADGNSIYYGASNNRVYKVGIKDSILDWQFSLDGPVLAVPRLFRHDLFIAGQDGRVYRASDARRKAAEVWHFATDGPIFSTPWVDSSGVYVASTDRFVYALDLDKGTRRWRKQFNTAELGDPVIVSGTLIIAVQGEGLYALAADTGKQLWRIPEPAHLLAADGDTLYLRMGEIANSKHSVPFAIRTVDLKTGKTRGEMPADSFDFLGATADPITIVLANRRGHVECLRAAGYPHLRPEQLVEVLAADESARNAPGAKPVTVVRPASRPAAPSDDLFRSTSKVPPVGGHGLVGKPEQPAEKPEPEEGEQPASRAAATKPAASKPAASAPASQPASDKAENGDESDKDKTDKSDDSDEKGDEKKKDDDSKDDDSTNGKTDG